MHLVAMLSRYGQVPQSITPQKLTARQKARWRNAVVTIWNCCAILTAIVLFYKNSLIKTEFSVIFSAATLIVERRTKPLLATSNSKHEEDH
jgi:hypothetical protein